MHDGHVGLCWIDFSNVKVRADVTTDASVKIEWAKIKARVFFPPDAFVIHGFEEVFIPYLSFGGGRLNGRPKSFHPTEEQKATAKQLLWSGLNQHSLQCYTKQYSFFINLCCYSRSFAYTPSLMITNTNKSSSSSNA